jgi:hypothetical protein
LVAILQRERSLHRRLAPKPFEAHFVFGKLMKRTREEVANTIDGFINGTGRQWDWDGFTSIRIDDPELEEIRKKCVALPNEFPPSAAKEYCSPAGMQVMRDLLQGLHAKSVS